MLHLSLALLGATASLRRGALVPEEADGPVERGTPGAKCWGQCGGPGSCPQFCGRPEQWSGSCCELKALGSDQPDECVNRGCIGFACCVQDCDVDWDEPAPAMTEADKAAAAKKKKENEARRAAEQAKAEEAERKRAAQEAKEQAARDWKAQHPNAIGTPGGECYAGCEMKSGRCPNFCGVPSVWSGSCCRADDDSAPECVGRGCKNHHCCVIDDGGDDHEAMEAAAKAAKAAEEQAAKDAKRRESRGAPGDDCWDHCDQKAGECPQYCSDPGVWTGACCKADAEPGSPQYDDACMNRGCTGFHCCVSDAPTVDATTGAAQLPDEDDLPVCEGGMCEIEEPEGGWGQQEAVVMPPFGATSEGSETRIDGPEQYGDIASSSSSVTKGISGLSRRDLRELFKGGKPSNDLSEVGLTVHCFDGTEDYASPWMPCHDERQPDCSLFNPKTGQFKEWWSASIINSAKFDTLSTSGIVLAPAKTQVLCSWESDMGSLISGCRANNVEPLPPSQLKDMMERSMHPKSGDKRTLYNEVLINTTAVMASLPHSIAAFVLFDDEAAIKVGEAQGEDTRLADKIVATTAYVGMLDHYKLDETDIPLLMINRSSPITVMDVSAGARKFLASHSYEQYRKNHPFKKQHSQTGTPTESRPDIAERGNMRVDNGIDVVACEKISAAQLIWGDRPCAKSTYTLAELDLPLQKALADSP